LRESIWSSSAFVFMPDSTRNAAMDTRTTPHRRQQTQYLILYNLICAVLWTAVLGRVLLLIPLVGFEHVNGGVGEFAKWTQTLALLEVVHSALGRLMVDCSLRPTYDRDLRWKTCLKTPQLMPECRSCSFSHYNDGDAGFFTTPSDLGRRQSLSRKHRSIGLL